MRRISTSWPFLRASRIGLYWPADGELDPLPLLRLADGLGKQCYLPVLSPIRVGALRNKLLFARHLPTQRIQANRFGIPEPRGRGRHLARPIALDLLIVPLVGFDDHCNRIGMGGGFYDRTLAYLRHHKHWRRPRLLGLAHECQRITAITRQPWDIRLDAIVTEARLYSKEPDGDEPEGASGMIG